MIFYSNLSAWTECAKLYKHEAALKNSKYSWTYSELNKISDKLITYFLNQGLKEAML